MSELQKLVFAIFERVEFPRIEPGAQLVADLQSTVNDMSDDIAVMGLQLGFHELVCRQVLASCGERSTFFRCSWLRRKSICSRACDIATRIHPIRLGQGLGRSGGKAET
jgi:hypothetical protein